MQTRHSLCISGAMDMRESNERASILVPRAYDPSGLRQESRALGATILKEQRK